MQTYHYSDERNVQILVALLKAYGIRTIVASPGTTNINFVWSVQQDPFFTCYSAVDERHAAYLACGMAAELKEPVVITCTGATASRNYLPGLTEAYYRKLPILAVTAAQPLRRIGHLSPQALDRSSPPPDTIRASYHCAIPQNETEARACELNLNKVLIALRHRGGGPAHVNLETAYSRSFSTTTLPAVRAIKHVLPLDATWPEPPSNKRIAVWLGAHTRFSATDQAALERFVQTRNAVVFTDKTSGYTGLGAVSSAFLCSQGIHANPKYAHLLPELVIHLGEISGDYATMSLFNSAIEFWRISEDGELRELTGTLTALFEMPDAHFFDHYAGATAGEPTYAQAWQAADQALRSQLPELPFSNPWIAQRVAPLLPDGCRLFLGILNSLRSWNLFPTAPGVESSSNVGGFGIDGCVSTALGAALAAPDRRVFVAVGDLAFFYDFNALGNRHVGKNLRILLINNAAGGEFHLYHHPGHQFGTATKDLIAADGHYGNHSRALVKHFAEDLGLTYLAAEDKASFEEALPTFLGDSDRSIVLECFTDSEAESEAHRLINSLDPAPQTLRGTVSKMLPQDVKNVIKKVLR